jgi:hypothetical protein
VSQLHPWHRCRLPEARLRLPRVQVSLLLQRVGVLLLGHEPLLPHVPREPTGDEALAGIRQPAIVPCWPARCDA